MGTVEYRSGLLREELIRVGINFEKFFLGINSLE